MSETAIRSQLYAIVAAVPKIGRGHDYERWSADWGKFISLFKTTIDEVDQIRGFEICRRGGSESLEILGMGPAATELKHVFVVRLYLGVNDDLATEKTFNALIEAVAAAVRVNKTLNGSATDHDYLQKPLIDTRMFGSVLCHHAELHLTVTEDL